MLEGKGHNGITLNYYRSLKYETDGDNLIILLSLFVVFVVKVDEETFLFVIFFWLYDRGKGKLLLNLLLKIKLKTPNYWHSAIFVLLMI